MNRFSQFFPSEYVPLDTNLLLKAGVYAEENAKQDLNKINKAIGAINAIPAKYSQDNEYLRSRLDQTKNNITSLISNSSEFTQPDFVGKINQEVYNFTNDPNIRQVLVNNEHWDNVQKSRVSKPNGIYNKVLSTTIKQADDIYKSDNVLTDMTPIPMSSKPFDVNSEIIKNINALKENKIGGNDFIKEWSIATNMAITGKGEYNPKRISNAIQLAIGNNPEIINQLELEFRAENNLSFFDPIDSGEFNKYILRSVNDYTNTYKYLQTESGYTDQFIDEYFKNLKQEPNTPTTRSEITPTKNQSTTLSNESLIGDTEAYDKVESQLEGVTEPNAVQKAIDNAISQSPVPPTPFFSTIVKEIYNAFSNKGTSINTNLIDKDENSKTVSIKGTDGNDYGVDLTKDQAKKIYAQSLANTYNSFGAVLNNSEFEGKQDKQENYLEDIIYKQVAAGKTSVLNYKGEKITQIPKQTDLTFSGLSIGKNPGSFLYVDNNKTEYYFQAPQQILDATLLIKDAGVARTKIGKHKIGNNQYYAITDIDKTTISINPNTKKINYNNATLSTFIAPIVTKEYYVNNFSKDEFLFFTKDGDAKEVNNSDEIQQDDIIIYVGDSGENFMDYTEFMINQYDIASKNIAKIFNLKN